MVPTGEGIEEEWQTYFKEKKDKLDSMNEEYKAMQKEFSSIEDSHFGTDRYNKLIEDMEVLADQISELDWEIIEEEKRFKQEIIQKYLD